ncbi:MAG: phosphoribosylformylglycinamidine synthase subunit PurL [Candidatus Hydrothermales bacterium]
MRVYKYFIKDLFYDATKEYKEIAEELGLKNLEDIEEYKILWIKSSEPTDSIEKVIKEWIIDENEEKIVELQKSENSYEVTYHFGVKDPEAEQIEKIFQEKGIDVKIKRGKKFIIKGNLSEKEIDYFAKKALYNKTIELFSREINNPFVEIGDIEPEIEYVKFRNLNLRELLKLSQEKKFYLLKNELLAIRDYYRKIGREPTLIELETFAQMWSEHCVHKTFKGEITYGKKRVSLLEKIKRASEKNKKNFCQVLFKDNAGIFKFDKNFSIAAKVETHNHPSALEPYGGSSTGVGGVIRDILGAGLGAKPIANIDVFCVGDLGIKHEELPEGVLHPKRILKGVVKGVEDYGNRMGIPTLCGAVIYEREYLTNPLVFCGTIGIIPSKFVKKRVKPGNLILLVGGKTGKDGIHGATFSSTQLSESSEEIHLSAVQIGDPITEKKLLDAIIEARDKKLFNFITDVGGGGISSAITENVYPFGAEVYLDKVLLKYKGLSPREIWISESQERMVIFTDKKNVEKLREIFEKHDVDLTVIGEVKKDGILKLIYGNKVHGEIDIKFIHEKRPKVKRETKTFVLKEKEYIPKELSLEELRETFLKILGSPNIRAKLEIVKRYDHEVQGKTLQKPYEGYILKSPSDCAIIKPIRESEKALALTVGILPSFSRISPYHSAMNAVDEVIRSLVSKGANPDKIVLLDNFCFANPEDKKVLTEIVESVMGAVEAAKGYKVPFISGKDSLYNEFKYKNKKFRILPTTLITGLGIIENEKYISRSYFWEEGNPIYLVGKTDIKEIGGSEFLKLRGILKRGLVPKVRPKEFLRVYRALYESIKKGIILSTHDVSQGGIFVAICEMCFALQKGVTINIESIERPDLFLFSESAGRIVVEVKREKESEFLLLNKKLPIFKLGYVENNGIIRIITKRGKIDLEVEKLYKEYTRSPFLP